jgi:hypothetical protein
LSPEEQATQPELEKLQAFTQTAQQSITSLIEQNDSYKTELEVYRSQSEDSQAVVEALTKANSTIEGNDMLFRAAVHYGGGDYESAIAELTKLKNVDMSESAKMEFDYLVSQLANKGFALTE